MKLKIGDFVHHESDNKIERMKLLIVDELENEIFLCRYIHHKEIGTHPERKFYASELCEIKS